MKKRSKRCAIPNELSAALQSERSECREAARPMLQSETHCIQSQTRNQRNARIVGLLRRRTINERLRNLPRSTHNRL
jgi:hypothetical protein